MTTPEARSGFVCPKCGKMFKTEKGYDKHYQVAHIESIKQKEYMGKWFVERDNCRDSDKEDGSPNTVLFPMSMDGRGVIRGKVWRDYGSVDYESCLNNYAFKEEISVDDAKTIIEGWHQKNIIDSEKRYQEDFKKMFDEKEEQQ